MTGSPFTVYTTCPASTVDSPKQYLTRLRDVSRWTEAAGCRGFLVYADNSLTDVWLTAQTVIERTDTLVPMVAVQPVYTHPYAVAKAVASLAWLHERQVDLNLITGGFAKHLAELGDPLREDHDGRYRRLREFALIIRDLLSTQSPTIFHGDHYRVDKATFHPPLPPALAPRLFVSGNSPASREVTDSLDATRLTYPAHPDDVGNAWRESAHAVGIRIGIIARETSAEPGKPPSHAFPPTLPAAGCTGWHSDCRIRSGMRPFPMTRVRRNPRRTHIGCTPSEHTKRSALIWWAVTRRSPVLSPPIGTWALRRSSWTCRTPRTTCTTP